MVRSEKLEETALWRFYLSKISTNVKRSGWVKDVYEAAANYLMDVRQTFQNYTLHDETHILNVMDAMGGLLGDQIGRLTVGETELLILAASLHDIGMVYTEEEKQHCYQDEAACRKFLRKYCPELLGCPAAEWAEDVRRWYLRTLHSFRISEVLQNKAWKELFDRCPLDVIPKRCVIAVCQAHGEEPEELVHNRDLNHLAANDADPLFCALLLRLGDLLDFDDTRAPGVLYNYVVCNEESRAEWDKHRSSAGFRYPESPSADALPYRARCTNPGVEHAVRDFLDWVDEELGNCVKLQKYCGTGWQREFPFPREVGREEIEAEGYMSGDFCLTMDQTQILELLTGENLYQDTSVFVRELLQNAIDATLLRGEMESAFVPEQSRIDLWEWNDEEGNIWFRIDDRGTGMTLGMLQRYFLKVGNSYYNSRELERDLREHGQDKKYHGISRFGIGFLSCFLCGDYAEVSTLYFDDDKSRREETAVDSYQTIHYGLRLQVTGLSGYYTLKNQAKHHQTEGNLPAPGEYGTNVWGSIERDGYRVTPGTSIVIRIPSGEFGNLNLREAVERYLCGARVPVYYNNERIGRTYEEIMTAAHEAEGEKIYEMTPQMKEQFDCTFPAVRGQYPKIAVSVVPLDTEENQILPELSGVLVKCELRFEQVLQWKVKDQFYEIYGNFCGKGKNVEIEFESRNKKWSSRSILYIEKWEDIEQKYGSDKVAFLGAEFEKHAVCPKAKEIAEVWEPFSEQEELHEMWRNYHNSQQENQMEISAAEMAFPDIMQICAGCGDSTYVYQGIVAGELQGASQWFFGESAMFLAEGVCKPMVDVGRSKISGLPLTTLLAISAVLSKYQMLGYRHIRWDELAGWRNISFKEWKKIKDSKLDRWLRKNKADFLIETKRILQKPCKGTDDDYFCLAGGEDYPVLDLYLMAHFQDKYRMTINYEEGQIISFEEKGSDETDETFDLFPPMMFCMAASSQSRRYICSANRFNRRGITADHPFIIWLLHNAAQLRQYYQRQFQRIVDCLRAYNAEDFVAECNQIRQQLLAFPNHYGVDVSSFPQLSLDDFWFMEEE